MASALEHLLSLRDAEDRHDLPLDEIQPLQMEAANERFAARVEQVPLLKNRAEASETTKISEPADLVPLLFAHGTYKTYSEPWLLEGQWDRMARWLQTVTTYDADGSSFGDVADLDEWVARLDAQKFYVACSSGTTGKPAMLGAAEADLEFSPAAGVSAIAWGSGVPPNNDRLHFGVGPRSNIARNECIRAAMINSYGRTDVEQYRFPVQPVTVGSTMAMILLRRQVADGTANAGQVAEFERLSAQRQADFESAQADIVEAVVKAREEKLFFSGFVTGLYEIAAGVRAQGYDGKDFNPENLLMTAGGLKGAVLPDDYRQIILETLNISDAHWYQNYSMQEINTPCPRCRAGRYHAPPWLIVLPLDEPGENLLDATNGEIEARAAFFDISLEGRWGGVISGDKVNVDFGPCACGHQGPTFGLEITRYADLEDGDKISCAGTIDAYVRGAV